MQTSDPPKGSAPAGNTAPPNLPVMSAEDVTDLNAMCSALNNASAPTDNSHDMLLRHAHMLNEMFFKMMDRLTQSVPKFETGYHGTAVAALNMQIQQKFTMLALQVQRQCADSMRAAHAIDYMQSLTQSRLPPCQNGGPN